LDAALGSLVTHHFTKQLVKLPFPTPNQLSSTYDC
jgi:hypothetical protein